VGIVILLTAACAVLPGVNQREQVRQAWAVYAEGRPAEAKKRLGRLARDDRATFMLANIALSEGDLTRAAELSAQLQKRQPTAGEVMLLGRLVQRRRESPGEAWLDSYAAAWREAGRPELTNVFTPQAWVLWPELKVPDSIRRAVLGTPSQLLLQPDLCNTKKGCPDLTSALSSDDLPAEWLVLAVQLARCPLRCQDQRCQRLAAELDWRFPESAEFALLGLIDAVPEDQPLTADLLGRLEAVLARPRLALSNADLRVAYEAPFRALGLSQPELRARLLMNVVWMWNPMLVGRLRRATLQTTRDGDAGLKVRAAQLSRRAGLLLLRDRTLMSWLQAVPFLYWAGKYGDEPCVRDLAEDVRAYATGFFPAAQSAATAVVFWPIPALMSDAGSLQVDDEITFYERLTGEPVPARVMAFMREQRCGDCTDSTKPLPEPTATRPAPTTSAAHRRGRLAK